MTLGATLLEVGMRGWIQRADNPEDPMAPNDATDRTIRLSRGEDATFRLTVYDEDDELVDLTAATITFRVKDAIADVAAVIAKEVGDGITILDQTDPDLLGCADIALVPSDTAALTPGLKVYEIRVTSAGLVSAVVRAADFVLYQEV